MIRGTFLAQNCDAHPMVTASALPDSFETPKTSNKYVDTNMLPASLICAHSLLFRAGGPGAVGVN
eukprot:1593392-Heterocapsa_arctica.AAC.1